MPSFRHTGLDLDAVTLSRPSLPSHNLPPTAAALPQQQATEPFLIQSSIPRGIGDPHPRVIKRKNDRYMLPRSPQSPTPQKIPGPVAQPLCRMGYAPTSVSKIAVEPLRIAAGRWSPAFPSQAERALDPRQALAFDPTMKHASGFSKLRSLDLFPALGLAASDFWPLFSRCLNCHNLMTTRTAPYHLCRNGAEAHADVINPAHYFLHLLDAHNMGYEPGVSEDVFRSIFHTCDQCGRYVTQRMAYHHRDGDVGEDLDNDYDRLDFPLECVYQRTGSDAGGCLSAREYRRIHCPAPCKS